VDGDEPRRENISEVVQNIGIRDAIDGGVGANGEEEDIGEEREAGLYTRYHAAGAKGLDE